MKENWLMSGQRLVIVRGLPGSGKSTFAKRLLDGIKSRGGKASRHENDDYHIICGKYQYDPARQAEAVLACQEETAKDLVLGMTVVVSNVFVTTFNLQWYVNLADSLGIRHVILRMDNKFEGIHNVPANVYKSMSENFVDITNEVYVTANGDDYSFDVFVDDVEVIV